MHRHRLSLDPKLNNWNLENRTIGHMKKGIGDKVNVTNEVKKLQQAVLRILFRYKLKVETEDRNIITEIVYLPSVPSDSVFLPFPVGS